jgi:Xaa-Pro aminopeptidase
MTESRLSRLREAANGLDALLVTQPTNILYLSAFRGSAGSLLITAKRTFLITDFRYLERVRREVDPSWELVDGSGLDMARDLLPKLLAANSARRLGFESEHVSHDFFTRLAALPEIDPVPTRDLVEALREIKEPEEVERMRAAVRLGERIFTELLPLIGPDCTEADLAAEIEYRARRHGASACSFSPIVASGPRAAQPHAGFSRERLVPEAPLILDLGVVLDDYCSDMTRTVFFRGCPPRWRRIYELVREAKDRAFERIAPGAAAREVDAAAREIITRGGFGEQFGHGLGHGVGLPFKGGPILHWTSEDILRPGHVASIEPGIYLPGEGGVRIEDLFVVTPTGAEDLNRLSTDLLVVG